MANSGDALRSAFLSLAGGLVILAGLWFGWMCWAFGQAGEPSILEWLFAGVIVGSIEALGLWLLHRARLAYRPPARKIRRPARWNS